MKQWTLRHHPSSLACICVMLAAATIVMWAAFVADAHAAPAAKASDPADPCELVATKGAITVYYCTPADGPAFLMNNIGFMTVAP